VIGLQITRTQNELGYQPRLLYEEAVKAIEKPLIQVSA
jgi:hypothetical protein